MSNCDDLKAEIALLDKQANSLIPKYQDLKSQITGLSVPPFVSGPSALAARDKAAALLSAIQQIEKTARNYEDTATIYSQRAKQYGCGSDVANLANDVWGIARTVADGAESFISDAQRKLRQLQTAIDQENQATLQATTNKSNAGTGSPGTANPNNPSVPPVNCQTLEKQLTTATNFLLQNGERIVNDAKSITGSVNAGNTSIAQEKIPNVEANIALLIKTRETIAKIYDDAVVGQCNGVTGPAATQLGVANDLVLRAQNALASGKKALGLTTPPPATPPASGATAPATVAPPGGAPTTPAEGTTPNATPKLVTDPTAPSTTPAPGATTEKPKTVDPKTGTQETKPATKTVPGTKGKPGTVEYVASLIAQLPVKGDNALATACPDKAKATATVKKLIADLNAQIASQIPTAKGADGKPATKAEKDKLSSELQAANSKLSKTLKDIDAKKCEPTPPPAEPAPAPEAAKPNTNSGLPGQTTITQTQGSLQDETNFQAREDWRVRLALAPEVQYLYRAKPPGILSPLAKTDGILFPYTPSITVTYNANYDDVLPTHSNYRIYQYSNSSVDNVVIGCDFTAQDTFEATYLLAVIHFLRSMTKMFYGKDENPKPGIPPPLCFLYGLGEFQFNAHPLVVTNFTYSLPTDVDYIRADTSGKAVTSAGSPQTNAATDATTNVGEGKKQSRLDQIKGFVGGVVWPTSVDSGGKLTVPNFAANQPAGVEQPTYVPTKMNISITCLPIVSRNNVSNKFSLRDYATGELLRGVKNKSGGFW